MLEIYNKLKELLDYVLDEMKDIAIYKLEVCAPDWCYDNVESEAIEKIDEWIDGGEYDLTYDDFGVQWKTYIPEYWIELAETIKHLIGKTKEIINNEKEQKTKKNK